MKATALLRGIGEILLFHNGIRSTEDGRALVRKVGVGAPRSEASWKPASAGGISARRPDAIADPTRRIVGGAEAVGVVVRSAVPPSRRRVGSHQNASDSAPVSSPARVGLQYGFGHSRSCSECRSPASIFGVACPCNRGSRHRRAQVGGDQENHVRAAGSVGDQPTSTRSRVATVCKVWNAE